MTDRIEYTREELIQICVDAIVPQEEWTDRDSYQAQFQVGECWALLSAGCEFRVEYRPEGLKIANPQGCYTDDETIWVTTFGKGFKYVEGFERGDDPYAYMDEETHYLPTRARLDRTPGQDWY